MPVLFVGRFPPDSTKMSEKKTENNEPEIDRVEPTNPQVHHERPTLLN